MKTLEPFKVVLIGYGKMGHILEQLVPSDFTIVAKVDDERALKQVKLEGCIAIDFSTPAAFKSHYQYLATNSLGTVVGTTGWQDEHEAILTYFKQKGANLIYANNFSVGVYIFSRLVAEASALTKKLSPSNPYILEMHHQTKLDRPSGTALQLQQIIKQHYSSLDLASVRAGKLNGTHCVGFVSGEESITLQHEAFNREGFAKGAWLAARALAERKVRGVISFNEWLDATL